MSRTVHLPRLLLPCLLIALPASAAMTETLGYRHYQVELRPGMTLLQAIDRVSPIREAGQVYHGYTSWQVQWRYQWWQEADGSCRVTGNHTTLTSSITLPALAGAPAPQQQQFDRYLEALRQHELGHLGSVDTCFAAALASKKASHKARDAENNGYPASWRT